MTSQGEAIDVVREVRISVSSFQVYCKLNILIISLDESDVRIPILVFCKNDCVTVVLGKF